MYHMERDIGESHWQTGIQYMRQHPHLDWVNVRLYQPKEISMTGWDYIITRKDGKLQRVTYFNGIPFNIRDA